MNDPTAWEGVDKAVVEKVAAEAGHPAAKPYINTDQGDLLLFLFLLAGAIGGFIVGYTFRGLFAGPRQPRNQNSGEECRASFQLAQITDELKTRPTKD